MRNLGKVLAADAAPKKRRAADEREWRYNNMSRLLVTAGWIADRRVLAYINANGFPMLRITHLQLPRNLDLAGMTLTQLAERADMSKQSMGALVDQLENFGLIERVPSRDDRRTKLICFTGRGLQLLSVARKAITALENDMLGLVGPRQMQAITSGLTKFCEQMQDGAEPEEPRWGRAAAYRLSRDQSR